MSKTLVAPSAADASVDQELLSYDFDKEGKPLNCVLIISLYSTVTVSGPDCILDTVI